MQQERFRQELSRLVVRTHDDRRLLRQAVRLAVGAADRDEVGRLLRIAEVFGDVRAVQLLRPAAEEMGLDSVIVQDFSAWLRECGVRWFDELHDPDQGVTFMSDGDRWLLERLAGERTDDRTRFWEQVLTSVREDQCFPDERKRLLELLAAGNSVAIKSVDSSADLDQLFREFCRVTGRSVIRTLQAGLDETASRNHVWLVQDSDGQFKIFKQLQHHPLPPLNSQPTEEEILGRLGPDEAWPRAYGVTELPDGTRLLRLSYVYGQTLDEILSVGPLDGAEVGSIISQLAVVLRRVLNRGVVYRDIRVQNVKWQRGRVRLLDFDSSLVPESGVLNGPLFAPMSDPLFAPPEVTLNYELWSEASVVFQLGVLSHILLTGHHPVGRKYDSDAIERLSRLEKIMAFAWPLATEDRDLSGLGEQDRHLVGLVGRMLARDPAQRPSLDELAESLEDRSGRPMATVGSVRQQTKTRLGTVLFPARMAIPHRGHIDFIARLLELGFHVRIALVMAYSVTVFDPFPKWIVMKMVARSLLDLGFSPDQFSFVLSPVHETDDDERMFFAFMPGQEGIVAVASGNPEIPGRFRRHVHLDQDSVFAYEGEDYETRSWGARLRRSVLEADYETFMELAATGVGQIMTFMELQQRYLESAGWVDGKVTAILWDEDDSVLAEGRVRAYSHPEQALWSTLEKVGHEIQVIDPYARQTVVRIDGRLAYVTYDRSELQGSEPTNLIIHFSLSWADG